MSLHPVPTQGPRSTFFLSFATRTDRALPMRPSKKVCFTSPTISPPPLSIVDQTDVQPEGESDTPLLPFAEDLTTVDLRGAESECDQNELDERDWLPNDDWCADDSSTSCANYSLNSPVHALRRPRLQVFPVNTGVRRQWPKKARPWGTRPRILTRLPLSIHCMISISSRLHLRLLLHRMMRPAN